MTTRELLGRSAQEPGDPARSVSGMNNFVKRDLLSWGLLLWVAGYLLGFIFYAFVPAPFIGWGVMPLGMGLTCLVLWKRVRVDSIRDSLLLGIAWSAIAVACDYLFIVKLLNPPDGYYKFDVYMYYLLTFALPVAAARLRRGPVAQTKA
jgi:hypothetical protein